MYVYDIAAGTEVLHPVRSQFSLFSFLSLFLPTIAYVCLSTYLYVFKTRNIIFVKRGLPTQELQLKQELQGPCNHVVLLVYVQYWMTTCKNHYHVIISVSLYNKNVAYFILNGYHNSVQKNTNVA